MNTWKAQERAFFSKRPQVKIDDEGIAVQCSLTERVVKEVLAVQKDFEYARSIQQQEDEVSSPRFVAKDFELARKLQDEEKHLADPKALERDLELARKLQHKENKHPIPHEILIHDNTRNLENDLKFALKLQEEEEEKTRIKKEKQKNQDASLTKSVQGGQKICSTCKQPARYYIMALNKYYHPKCFICLGCHEVIKADEPICATVGEDGEEYPLHRSCHAELYGMKCVACNESFPINSEGKISYVKHPFFTNNQICPKHAENCRRCTGCYRYEPKSEVFADLGDGNRHVCQACLRTVIVDSDDAKPLWDKVICFFRNELKLPIWNGMNEIPVVIVGHHALNEQLSGTAHSGSSQIMTRGLCLSEHQRGHQFEMPSMRFNLQNSSFIPTDEESRGHTLFQIPDVSVSSVTAILCTSGLSSDLTASILAHEATHAWIKLNPNYKPEKRIPLIVEEGCCQLIAMLFLSDGLPPPSTECSNNEPSDERLRQFFKFSIETDTDEVYGDGFRLAAKAHACIGLKALLNHVVLHQEFPKV